MANSCRIIGSEDTNGDRERYIFLLESNNDVGTIYKTIDNMKNLMMRFGRKNVAIPRPDGIPLACTRKILEYIFHSTDINVIVYGPRTNDSGARNGTVGAKKNNAIIIENQGKQYADLLKQVKEGLANVPAGTELRSIKKTKQGNLLIELNKDELQQTKNVADIIQRSIGGVKLRVEEARTGNNRRIQIRDLDLLATEEEIKGSIVKIIPDINDLKIIALKEVAVGCQSATIELSDKNADRILENGFLTVGIVRCRMREWVNVPTCFKCWEPGHVASGCTGPDRTKLCRRCGRPATKQRIARK